MPLLFWLNSDGNSSRKRRNKVRQRVGPLCTKERLQVTVELARVGQVRSVLFTNFPIGRALINGHLVHGLDTIHHSRDMGSEFATPAIDPDQLVWSRRDRLSMLDVAIAEILDYLVELGLALDFDKNEMLQQAFAGMNRVSALGPRVLENCYRDMTFMFDKRLMQAEIKASIGDSARLDG